MFFRRKKASTPWVSAVIVAAGSSRRMGEMDKLWLLLDGIPVVVHSIGQFESCHLIQEIVIVCRPEQIPDYYRVIQEFELQKVSTVVAGGSERQESVFNGIAVCSGDAAFFAIHDGARPLVTPEEIEHCVLTAFSVGAAAVGVPLKDTVKMVKPDGLVESTPDRSRMAAIQTPQVFAADLYRDAMKRAQGAGCVYTDDCQLVERTGHAVAVTPGSYQNIKITTPEDIAVAHAILSYRQQGEHTWQAFE